MIGIKVLSIVLISVLVIVSFTGITWADEEIYKIHGFGFGPYIDEQEPGDEIDEEQIRNRLTLIAPYITWIRTYGCGMGLERIGEIAHELELNVAMGAWLSDDMNTNDQEIARLITEAEAGHVDIAIVGNDVLSGAQPALTEIQLINYIDQVKQAKQVNQNLQVTTAAGYEILSASPSLVDACDILMLNSHPYWGGIDVDRAVAVVSEQFRALQVLAGDKLVTVGETGWPDDGDTRVNAVPSLSNSRRYFKNMELRARTNGVQLFYFEAFDEPWKADQEESGVGDHWGVFTNDGNLKDGFQDVFTSKTWSYNYNNSPDDPTLEIAYGTGEDFPQYGVLHLNSGYLRLNFGPGAGWGPSIITLPSFWEGGALHQSAQVIPQIQEDGETMIINYSSSISSLDVDGKITLQPPVTGMIAARIDIEVTGNVVLDNKPGEAYQMVKLPSMNIGNDNWDSEKTFVGTQDYSIPVDGWIIQPTVEESSFGYLGGTSDWKINAPSMDMILDTSADITGWVDYSQDSNDDNISLWASSDQVVTDYGYTVFARPRYTENVSFELDSFAGNESIGTVNLAVKLNSTQDVPVGVTYEVSGGTASGGGVDYTLTSETIIFAPGETSKNIPISVVDDGDDELNETIIIKLKTADYAFIGTPNKCTYTILNDDSASGGSGGGCFIATAAYGTSLAEEVMILCRFRDNYLLHTKTGRDMVKLYNYYSPPLAGIIKQEEDLRDLTRLVLSPMVRSIELFSFAW